jgi:hypothetical protein
MTFSSQKLNPRQEKIFRVAAKVVFGLWVLGGSIAFVMGAIGFLFTMKGEDLVAAILFGLAALIGVAGWRLAGRPLEESYAALKRRSAKIEALLNGRK